MSSPSAAIADRSGAPNASRGRSGSAPRRRRPLDRRPAETGTRQLASTAASQASAASRAARGAAHRHRRDDGRRRAASAAAARVDRRWTRRLGIGRSTSGSLPARWTSPPGLRLASAAGGHPRRSAAPGVGTRSRRPHRSSPQPSDGSPPRFAPLSPRVAVLIVAAIVVGLLLWMARDSVRPFVLGLLLVYLLDIPVRRLVRRGMRRSLAILIVYIVAIVAIIEFLALTLTPLINEIFRLHRGLPAAGRPAQRAPPGARRLLLAPPDPAGHPRVDRQRHRRRRRERRAGRRDRPRLPAAARHRRGQPASARSSATSSCRSGSSTSRKDQAKLVDAFDRALPARLALRHAGSSFGSSSASSASGSAPRSSSASPSASSRSSA